MMPLVPVDLPLIKPKTFLKRKRESHPVRPGKTTGVSFLFSCSSF